MKKLLLTTGIAGVLTLFQAPCWAQMIGTFDNFDCFNDTGTEAEGFEIDIEDVNCPDDTEGSSTCDLTRIFPSNFSNTPWVIRYGIPTITTYDYTNSQADPQHTYDQGHEGGLGYLRGHVEWFTMGRTSGIEPGRERRKRHAL